MKSDETPTKRLAGQIVRQSHRILAVAVMALLVLWTYPGHAKLEIAIYEGALDQTFGAGGMAVNYFPGRDALVEAVAIQPDGKIVAAGFLEPDTTLIPYELVLARYNPNGSLDLSFGANGMVTDEHFAGFGVAIQPDGKLVVAGMSNASGPVSLFALARFNSDGSPDTSFGSDGKVLTDFGGVPITGANGVAFTPLILPNGKIVAGGTVSKADGKEAIALVRYTPEGSLDTSFGTGGKISTDFSYQNAAARTFCMQVDRKIVASGGVGIDPVTWADFFQPDDPTENFAVARFNPDGSSDPAFGNGGLVTVDIFGYTDGAFALDIQPSGKMVAGGVALRSTARETADFALIRLNPDGSLDTGFGTNGKVTVDYNLYADMVFAVLTQPDGKIIAVGRARMSPFSRRFALARFNRDGSLDLTFGVGGKVTTTYYAETGAEAYAAALLPDGRIIAGGYCWNLEDTDAIMLACYYRGPLEGDFSVLADTQSQTVEAGSSTSFTINVQSVTWPPVAWVNLSPAVNPSTASITTSFEPSSIVAGSSSTLTVNTSVVTQPDIYRITVIGNGGEITHTTSVILTVTQGSPITSPQITGAELDGKKLYVYGKNFDIDADLLLNGEEQKKTSNDALNPTTMLIAKKSGKKIALGETVTLQVRNLDGRLSNEYSFTRAIPLPAITGAEVTGSKLYVYGNNFDLDAELLLNGEKQKKTSNDEANPSTTLIARKSGDKIAPGQMVTLQVRNFDGTLSNEYSFTRPVE
jgi:uncharacterized delta-60 repeat protein